MALIYRPVHAKERNGYEYDLYVPMELAMELAMEMMYKCYFFRDVSEVDYCEKAFMDASIKVEEPIRKEM